MTKLVDLAIPLVFIGSGTTLALMNLNELFIVYYSGGEPDVSTSQKAELVAECVLLFIATAVIAVRMFRV